MTDCRQERLDPYGNLMHLCIPPQVLSVYTDCLLCWGDLSLKRFAPLIIRRTTMTGAWPRYSARWREHLQHPIKRRQISEIIWLFVYSLHERRIFPTCRFTPWMQNQRSSVIGFCSLTRIKNNQLCCCVISSVVDGAVWKWQSETMHQICFQNEIFTSLCIFFHGAVVVGLTGSDEILARTVGWKLFLKHVFHSIQKAVYWLFTGCVNCRLEDEKWDSLCHDWSINCGIDQHLSETGRLCFASVGVCVGHVLELQCKSGSERYLILEKWPGGVCLCNFPPQAHDLFCTPGVSLIVTISPREDDLMAHTCRSNFVTFETTAFCTSEHTSSSIA